MFRIRMVETFYDNFKNKFSSEVNLGKCPLCFTHYDDQPSLLSCPKILEDKNLNDSTQQIRYTDIFKSLEFQAPAIQVLEKALQYRMKLLNNN